MKFNYPDAFDLALPPGHPFPDGKYEKLRRLLLDEHILSPDQLESSPLADDEMLFRAHDRAYVRAVDSGEIEPAAMRRIGFPWSANAARRARATAGGAVAAALSALQTGLSGQLAGGTHHAHRDFGAGYCIFNDFAVAALAVLAGGLTRRVAIVDLDVHQGDGNASILGDRDDVFILSVHAEKNFPFRKAASHLDVALPDGATDHVYLEAIEKALLPVWAFGPDLVLYQAGVDPLAEDRLGRLALTEAGLISRDRLVLEACAARAVPISMALGGGYADPIELSVRAHANTYRVAREIFGF